MRRHKNDYTQFVRTIMASIGFGVMIYNRLQRFERLLRTVPTDLIDHVYIANDGPWTAEKQDIVDRALDIEYTVLDPDTENLNLGRGRELIVDASQEDYLLVTDSDHEVPKNVHALYDILEETGYGGVCGLLVEPEHNSIFTGCRDLSFDGST